MASFLNNIGYANRGIYYFFKAERNGRIQAFIAVATVCVAFLFCITSLEWCIILSCVSTVIGFEMMNTAIERICEMLSKEYHPTIKVIKDVAAGAVWLASIVSVIVGIIIFYPYLLKLCAA